jgi:Tol biopolymer transport system component
MRPQLRTFYFFLFAFLNSCTSQIPPPPLETSLYVYRFDPPALIEFSEDFQLLREIPFALPPSCGLFNLFSPPVGRFLAVELSCPNGQTVLLLDTGSAAITQLVRDTDSHFLAWAPEGEAVYLKIDSLGSPQVVRAGVDGRQALIPVTEFTYDLASSARDDEFTFTFSGGLGQGSELWLARRAGKTTEQLYADPFHYISFARFSPNGAQLAFIKIPDTQTPFTVGELWVMKADGSNVRKLAGVDAGHGYAASWSPDGERIAFVVRENPEEARADQSSEALISNLYLVDVKNGELTQVTHLEQGHVETPFWSPDGNTLAFPAVINDRMEVQTADLATGEIRPLMAESACCPAWMRK